MAQRMGEKRQCALLRNRVRNAVFRQLHARQARPVFVVCVRTAAYRVRRALPRRGGVRGRIGRLPQNGLGRLRRKEQAVEADERNRRNPLRKNDVGLSGNVQQEHLALVEGVGNPRRNGSVARRLRLAVGKRQRRFALQTRQARLAAEAGDPQGLLRNVEKRGDPQRVGQGSHRKPKARPCVDRRQAIHRQSPPLLRRRQNRKERGHNKRPPQGRRILA